MDEIYNRINKIDKICYSQEHGISVNERRKFVEQVINKYYDSLVNYKYCDNPENIKIGSYIKYVNMDMTKINYGLVTNITKQYNETITFVIKSTFNNKYWKLDPYKYYLFHKKCMTKQKKKLNKLITEYINNIE